SVAPSTNSPSRATKRTNSTFGAFLPHPTHVRIASRVSDSALVVSFICGRARGNLFLFRCLFRCLFFLPCVLYGFGAGDRDGLLDHLAAGLTLGQCCVGRDAAEACSRNRRVRAALAVGEDRRAAAGEVLACLAAGESSLRLGGGELGLGLDVDLPPGQSCSCPG